MVWCPAHALDQPLAGKSLKRSSGGDLEGALMQLTSGGGGGSSAPSPAEVVAVSPITVITASDIGWPEHAADPKTSKTSTKKCI